MDSITKKWLMASGTGGYTVYNLSEDVLCNSFENSNTISAALEHSTVQSPLYICLSEYSHLSASITLNSIRFTSVYVIRMEQQMNALIYHI